MSEEETRVCTAAWEDSAAAPPLDQTAGEMAGEMEALLLACEDEAAALKAKLESMAKILGLLAKRMPHTRGSNPGLAEPRQPSSAAHTVEPRLSPWTGASILAQRDEMLEAQNDPSRLLARKPAGFLLKEEKLRTSVEKHLPQMTLKVRELAAEWQAEHGGEVLRYEGQPLLELLEAEERAEASKKLEEKERKAAEKAAATAKKEEKRNTSLPGRPSTAPAKRLAAGAAPAKRPNPSAAAAAVVAPRVAAAQPPKAPAAPPAPAAAPPATPTPPPPTTAAPPTVAPPSAAPPPAVEVEHAVPSDRVLQILDMQMTSPTKLESPAKKPRLSLEQDKENPEAATAGVEID
jgi:hypothetical protein